MIKILVGPSGVGKTTFASALVKNEKNHIIVSRDNLRMMLYGYTESSLKDYYTHDDINNREKYISKVVIELIDYNLKKDKTVVLDNTNLKMSYINKIKKKFYYTDIITIDVCAEFHKLDIDDAERVAKIRNVTRTKAVNNSVITKQFKQYQSLPNEYKNFTYFPQSKLIEQDSSRPKCVIFDVDGTLAENHTRSPYDWKRVREDACNEYVANIARKYMSDPNYTVIICTGRDGSCEDLTKEWLAENDLGGYDEFYIREKGSGKPDWEVKEEIWQGIADRLYIECLYDDRAQVIEHGVRIGLNMINVKGVKQDF